MKVFQQQGYILHCTPYSESSLLVNIFTREYGRLTLIAKGCRRKKSTTRGMLLPFKPVLLSWSGKGQLPILTGVEQHQHVPELSGTRLFCGYYINELILKLLHRYDPHDQLFDHYHESVLALLENESHHIVLRIFEKHLLKEIGFGLVLDHDIETGEAIAEEKLYRYFPEKGPMEVSDNHSDGLVIKGKTLLAIEQQCFEGEKVLSESRRLIGTLIDIQLNGKELRSRKVMRAINRYSYQENSQTVKT